MKKFLVIAMVALGSALFTNVNAQEIADNALGLRIGGNDGFGPEISYQRAVGNDNNRLEFDLGWRNSKHYDIVKLVGLYQWVWNIEGGFNWYAGAGAGFASIDDDRPDPYDDESFIFLAGDVGIEYNFDIPLVLSLDLRPEISFIDNKAIDDFSPDFAIGIRYQF
ncbi:MAG: hypothetical protein ABGW99_19395 [Zunongwangia sp.]|uniref:Outer membrane protein beta-barrel domain-containing protein n=1 Tax=Zunongwangia pacifica TaxID=2911062 RepID=A0A9X1ZX75_9FLAO|nr:hypothetical protein [Zunongwangia pacifica]MCL6220168.1 hypothetical protein [Zunongwangia pacifica]